MTIRSSQHSTSGILSPVLSKQFLAKEKLIISVFQRKVILFFILHAFIIITLKNDVYAQVGIGTATPVTSSLLDLTSTTKGMLVPRMTSAQKNAISSPANGLLIYQTDGASGFWYWCGTDWLPLLNSTNGWGLSGNASTVDGTNFIGTTDNIPFAIKVNNQKAGRIDNVLENVFLGYQAGNVTSGLGTNNTYMGHQAGLINTSGKENTFLGYQSGQTNTTGSKNTMIGYGADVTSAALSRAVAIGYNAKAAASNSLILGGTGADTVQVGIGTTTPSATLNVVGDGILTRHFTVGSTALPTSNFRMLVRNGPGMNGLIIKSGENSADISLRIEDDDASFNILDVETDHGHFVFGKTFAWTLANRASVYGIDNQNDGANGAADANLQFGVYRMAGVPISPYNIGGGIVNSEVSSTTATSTTSTSAVLLSGITSTPAVGTYIVTFNATAYTSSSNQPSYFGIYKAGTLVASSLRMSDFASSSRRFSVNTQAMVTVNGSETIEIRYYTSSNTLNVLERSMILLKVSN
jgi:hypothetical protein